MGNYLTLEILCAQRRLHEIDKGGAVSVLAVLCHLADKDGEVMADRSTVVEGWRIDNARFARAVKVLTEAGVLMKAAKGQPGRNGWRRVYRLLQPTPRGYRR